MALLDRNQIDGDVTITNGTFTSAGIADVGGGIVKMGDPSTFLQFINRATDQYTVISGGAGTSSGANMVFYSSGHSNTGDFLIRNDSNTFFTWDESLGKFIIATGVDVKTTALTITNDQTATFTGDVVITGQYLTLPTSTTAALVAVGNAVNTDAGKVQGAMLYNTDTDNPVYAVGNAASDIWVDGAGSTAHSPA